MYKTSCAIGLPLVMAACQSFDPLNAGKAAQEIELLRQDLTKVRESLEMVHRSTEALDDSLGDRPSVQDSPGGLLASIDDLTKSLGNGLHTELGSLRERVSCLGVELSDKGALLGKLGTLNTTISGLQNTLCASDAATVRNEKGYIGQEASPSTRQSLIPSLEKNTDAVNDVGCALSKNTTAVTLVTKELKSQEVYAMAGLGLALAAIVWAAIQIANTARNQAENLVGTLKWRLASFSAIDVVNSYRYASMFVVIATMVFIAICWVTEPEWWAWMGLLFVPLAALSIWKLYEGDRKALIILFGKWPLRRRGWFGWVLPPCFSL